MQALVSRILHPKEDTEEEMRQLIEKMHNKQLGHDGCCKQETAHPAHDFGPDK